jgi:type VI secretion system protein ImpK
MSDSRDNDKTVIGQPSVSMPQADPGNQTVMIPRPGARSSAPATATAAMAGSTAGVTAAPNLANLQALSTDFGDNPLINNASTLLAVTAKLRKLLSHDNPQELQRQLADEIRQFDARCRAAQLPPEQIVTARYVLCTAIDEAVMNTPWGASSGWSQHSLLSMFHNETFGGEKFFNILDKLLQNPGQHADSLELIYLLISLGFEGKYKLDPRGRDQLEMIREKTYRSIENLRGPQQLDLSPHWQSQATGKQGIMHYVPLWVVACCFLALLALAYTGARVWLNLSTAPTAVYLDQLDNKIKAPAIGARE